VIVDNAMLFAEKRRSLEAGEEVMDLWFHEEGVYGIE
jgi:hypothetical protein